MSPKNVVVHVYRVTEVFVYEEVLEEGLVISDDKMRETAIVAARADRIPWERAECEFVAVGPFDVDEFGSDVARRIGRPE